MSAIQRHEEVILTSKGTCVSSRAGSFWYSPMETVMEMPFSQGMKNFFCVCEEQFSQAEREYHSRGSDPPRVGPSTRLDRAADTSGG